MLKWKHAIKIGLGVAVAMLKLASHAQAQSIVNSSIVIQNATYGTHAAAVNTNGPNGGCKSTVGYGTPPSCTGYAASIPTGMQTTASIAFTSNPYNTLYQNNVEYYLSTKDPNGQQSLTTCSWQIQIVQQTSQSGQPWQGNVRYSGVQDTSTPLVPACSYSNFSVNSSTGAYSITVTFGGH